jgi:hypothetical protein
MVLSWYGSVIDFAIGYMTECVIRTFDNPGFKRIKSS